MKRNYSRLSGALLAAVLAGFAATACSQPTEPYARTSDTVRLGSLHYAQAGCARCHGSDWNGKGEEAAILLKERGLQTPDFRAMNDPEKTPVDYFKAITAGTAKFPEHHNQTYTDAARWQMAHFAYSFAPQLKGAKAEKRAEAIVREMSEARAAYAKAEAAGDRRWQIGFQPVAARLKGQPLTELTGGESLSPEVARGTISPERLQALHASRSRGKELYTASCAKCHGIGGSGAPSGIDLGSVDCAQQHRTKCGVVYSTGDISGAAGKFRAAHAAGNNGFLPSFGAWSPEDVDAVFAYLKVAE